MKRCLLLVAILVGCAGKVEEAAQTPGPSGLLPGRPVDQLTSAERERLCDWMAERAGGYGYKADCGGGVFTYNFVDRADCLTDLAAPCTVRDYETCAEGFASADWCSAEIHSLPACRTAWACRRP